MSNDQVYESLKDVADKVQQNVPLSKWTTFKIGGTARYMVRVGNEEQLLKVLEIASENGLDIFILGGGSNMLAADEGFDGIVIKYNAQDITINEDGVTAQAGAKSAAVAQESVSAGFTGLEWCVGVPGTVGGAVRGNAGASGGEIRDNLASVHAYIDGEVVELDNEECNFGYRHSDFKDNKGIILSANFKLEKGDKAESMKKLQECLGYRSKTQPKGYASSGCIFKNKNITEEEVGKYKEKGIPEEFLNNKRIPAGWLIDKSGMKGECVGSACVSDEHGNFIINKKGATASDIKQLIEMIKDKVYTEYGAELEEEIQYLGF